MADRRHRRILKLALGGLFAALLLSEAGFFLRSRGLEARFEEVRTEELERGFKAVGGLLQRRESDAFALADRIASDLAGRGLLTDSGPFARVEMFRILAAAFPAADVSGILVRNAGGVPIAWDGRTYAVDPDTPLRRASGIVRSAIYRVIFAEAPVERDGEVRGSVTVYSAYDVNYPLENRYLRRGDFETETADRLGLRDIDLSTGPSASRRAEGDPSRLGGEIRNQAGETIRHMNVRVHPLDVHLARLSHTRKKVRAAILGLILLVVLVAATRGALGPHADGPRLLFFFASVVLARIGWFQVGFPSALFEGPVFDPVQFSVLVEVFGGDLGLLHSPGDLLLTSLAVTGAVWGGMTALRRRVARRLHTRHRPLQAIPFLVGSALFAVALTQAWLELIHGLAFYSTVEFFPEQVVFPATPAVVLLLSLFFLSMALMALVGAALLVTARVFAGESRLRLVIGLGLVLPAVFLTLIAGTDLSPALAGAAAFLLVSAAAALSAWRSLGVGIRIGAVVGLVSLFTVSPLMREIWREVRADVEEEAPTYFEPMGEAAVAEIFEADLVDLAADTKLVGNLTEDPFRARPRLAFELWAASPLSGSPRGAEISILERATKRPLSRFEIDVPPREWLPSPLPGHSPEQTAVWELPGTAGGRRQRFLVGSAPIRSDDGEFLGQLVVRMPVERPLLGGPPRPEILRSYEEGSFGGESRELHVSEYEGDVLTRTTSPDYPRVHRAPADVASAVLGEGRPAFWKWEEIAGAPWVNLYRPKSRRTG